MNKLLICVKKKQKIELTKEEGWYSEAELVELGWAKPGSQLLLFIFTLMSKLACIQD